MCFDCRNGCSLGLVEAGEGIFVGRKGSAGERKEQIEEIIFS